MAEFAPNGADHLARAAVAVLHRARTRLSAVASAAESNEVRWRIVDDAADQLAVAASDPACPVMLGTVLLDWRDRLGSCVLAARALADLDVHPDLAEQLLCRGLDEAIEESPRRLLDIRLRLMASPTPGR
jgi:hypothetical protein